MIDVLIIIDNPFREYLNLNLLTKILSKKNLKSRIVSKHLFEDAIYRYKPQSIIIPRITSGFKKIFSLSDKLKFNIYMLPCEHGGGDKDRIISFLVGHENKDNFKLDNFKHYKNITKLFAPSALYKEYCIDSGLFSSNQIDVTGTISSDFWFEKISESIVHSNNKISIGIASSFKSTFFGIHFNSFLEGLLFLKNITNQKEFPNSIEKNIFFHSFEALSFIFLLKIIEENPEINFSWRLHPQENLKGAQLIGKKIKNLKINRDIIPYNWIKNQSLIMLNTSTMIYDSYFLNVPVISLIDLIPDVIKNNLENTKKPLNTTLIQNPKSINEVLEMIKNKNFNQLVKIDKEKMLKESLLNFNFPRKDFAVNSICNSIINEKQKNQNSLNIKLISNISNIVADVIINLKMIRVTFSKKYQNIHLDKVLNPINLKDKLKINQFINNIIEKIV